VRLVAGVVDGEKSPGNSDQSPLTTALGRSVAGLLHEVDQECPQEWGERKKDMQRIKKGDTVEVIAGDERGKRGEVHEVRPKDERVIVSGLNLVKKHQRRTGNVRTQVGIIEREAPLHLSNVMLVCKSCNEATRVGFEGVGANKSRVCRSCGALIE
jgi:large subunit ribosomal protein L24